MRLPYIPQQVNDHEQYSQPYPKGHQPEVRLRQDVNHAIAQPQDEQYPEQYIEFEVKP